MSRFDEANNVLIKRFSHDCLISIATVDGTRPHVRTVDGFYEDGAFYVVTNTRSNKMKHIQNSPEVAVCGDWFTGHGIGENLGHVLAESNAAMMAKLRDAFAAWYGNGHVNEADPNTCLLRVRMTDGVLFDQGTKYTLDFAKQTA